MSTAHTRLPPNLVQHVACELLQRVDVIKSPITRVREISPAPLPLHTLKDTLKNLSDKITIEQWHLNAPAPTSSLLKRLNPFAAAEPLSLTGAQLNARAQHATPAQLVLAPFALDNIDAAQILQNLEHMPNWFAADGVLLFATLGAGALPEWVNHDETWLAHLSHLPTIMQMGQRLQELRFGLPVLDVETVRIGYDNAHTLWMDVLNLSPSLRALDIVAQNQWQQRAQKLFEQGLRELSLQIIYGQVWQPSAQPIPKHTHTVSLESLTASLNNVNKESS